MYFQNGEVQRDGNKGLLAAGQQRDGLQLLAGGLYLDLDAAVEDIALVLQLQPRLAAAEQLQKRLLEALVQQLELLGKMLVICWVIWSIMPSSSSLACSTSLRCSDR